MWKCRIMWTSQFQVVEHGGNSWCLSTCLHKLSLAALALAEKKNMETRNCYLCAIRLYINRLLLLHLRYLLPMQHLTSHSCHLSQHNYRAIEVFCPGTQIYQVEYWKVKNDRNHSLSTLKCCHFVSLFVISLCAVSTYREDGNWTLPHNLISCVWKQCALPKPWTGKLVSSFTSVDVLVVELVLCEFLNIGFKEFTSDDNVNIF